jgi:hypothetical protein
MYMTVSHYMVHVNICYSAQSLILWLSILVIMYANINNLYMYEPNPTSTVYT